MPNGLGICPLGEGDAGGCFNGIEFGEAHGMGAASSRPFVGASEMDEQDGSEVYGPRFAMRWSAITFFFEEA